MNAHGEYDSEFRFVGARELEVRPTAWLVHGLLESSTVVLQYGQAGVAKTFLALDVACCVATGLPFHDCEVLAGGVFYVGGEGYNGLARRIVAWTEHNQVPRPEHLFCSQKAADLFYPAGAERIVDEIERIVSETATTPRLIVIDTLARNFSGEENSARDVGQFVKNIDYIRSRWDATVLVVHHSGKELERGARGSTALRSAVDAEFEVTRDKEGLIRVTCKKMKDGALPEPQGYALMDVEATSSEGEMIRSAVLNRVVLGSDDVRVPSGKNQALALATLKKMYAEETISGVDCPSITDSEWRTRCREAGLEPNRIGEAIRGLIKNQFAEVAGDRVILPGWSLADGALENASSTDSHSSDQRYKGSPQTAYEAV